MNERRCLRCGLSDRHPLAQLGDQETCALCRRAPEADALARQRDRAHRAMLEAIDAARSGSGPHVTVALSGGKDSSATLLRLRREHRLEAIAVAVDNGYLSASAEENLRAVTTALDVPLILARPPRSDLDRLFGLAAREEPFAPIALQRASGVCNACIGLVKSICLSVALESRTPLLAWGWSPGQAPLAAATHRPPRSLLATFEQMRSGPLGTALGPKTRELMLSAAQIDAAEQLPTFIHPLAVEDYDEHGLREELRELGWSAPTDTDPNSTNCRLNALGNHLHRRKHGVNPYSLELASLVREGWMTRTEAIARLTADEDWDTVVMTADELGVTDLLAPGGGK